MVYTSVVVALFGPPSVRTRTVSNTLKEEMVRMISVKNSCGDTMGMVIFQNTVHFPALSSLADS